MDTTFSGILSTELKLELKGEESDTDEDDKDVGSTLFRNVGELLPTCSRLHRRRQYSSRGLIL
jgi:hypothetical protein